MLAALAASTLGMRTQTGRVTALPTEFASNVFFARGTINGAGTFWFTVDTGATLTVIDPEAAERAQLVVRNAGQRANVGIAAGATSLQTTAGVRVDVGGLPSFAPPFIYVVNVRSNSAALGHTVDGVIGTDVLSRHVVEFDYALKRVRVGRAPDPQRAVLAEVRITVEDNVLIAPAVITLPDRSVVTARLLIDTGSNGSLTLTSPFVRRHSLSARFPSQRASLAVGINGTTKSTSITLGAVAFGKASVASPDAALSEATSGLEASEDFDGIVGADVLRHFTLTIDYPARRLTFAPPG